MKKKYHSFLILVPVLFFGAGIALTATPVLDVHLLNSRFNSDDPNIRREAVESIFAGKAEDRYALVNSDIIKFLTDAVSDPDISVKQSALQSLYGIVYYSILMKQAGTNSAEYIWDQQSRGTNAPINLLGDSRLKATLLNVLDDENPEIRKLSVNILVSGFPPSSNLENIFVMRFEREPVDEIRIVLVEGIVLHKYSSASTLAILKKALNDLDRSVRIKAAEHLLKVDVTNSLPVVINQFSTEDDEYVRRWWVKAIQESGDAARPYRSVLQENLSRTQSDAEREMLSNLINKLSSGSSHTP